MSLRLACTTADLVQKKGEQGPSVDAQLVECFPSVGSDSPALHRSLCWHMTVIPVP